MQLFSANAKAFKKHLEYFALQKIEKLASKAHDWSYFFSVLPTGPQPAQILYE